LTRFIFRAQLSGAMSERSLTGEEWKLVLNRLAEHLDPSTPTKMLLIGGVAVALAYGTRRTTRDVDVVLEEQSCESVIRAANNIAAEFDLEPGWLNENAKHAGFLRETLIEGGVVLQTPTLKVVVPSLAQLGAMKLAAIRGQTDVDDAMILLKHLRASGGDAEDIWALVGGLLPVADRDKARYNLLKLWEILDESE